MKKIFCISLIITITAFSISAEETEFKVLRDFCKGSQGWKYSSSSKGGSPELTTIGGKKCIGIPVSFPEPVQLYKERGPRGILGSIRIIRVGLFIPAGAQNIEVSFFAKDRDGHWFHVISDKPLRTGAWNTVLFNISSNTQNIMPDGHFSSWGETEAYLANALGIQIYSKSSFKGEIGVSLIEGREDKGSSSDLRIIDLELPIQNTWVYEKYEVTFKLSREFENPFDPEKVSITGEFKDAEGETSEVSAFYCRNYIRRWDEEKQQEVLVRKGAGMWKLRYAPKKKGQHTFRIKAQTGNASVISSEFSFRALPARTPGYVAVDKTDSRYFAFSNGSFFYPVGHNVRSPNDPRCARVMGIAVPLDRGTYAYDKYFANMSKSGENCLEIWMCSWWVGLEWIRDWNGYHGLGYYNLENAWKLDYLVSLAEKYNMYIHLVIDNHGKLSVNCDPEWKLSPYNRQNGGFLSHPNEFFSSTQAKKLYKRKLRYILARWGWSPRIMGFELWSELDLVGQGIHKRHQVYEWHKEMADMIHAYPFPHLVTTHYSGNYNVVDPVMVGLKQIDYAAGDGYRQGGIFPTLVKQSSVRYRSFRKPGLITEYGGSWHGTTEARLRADLHAGMWAGFLSDLAGIPFFWWFEQVERRNLYFHYKAFSRFIKGEDKRGRDLTAVSVILSGTGSSSYQSMSAVDKKGGFVWIYNTKYMLEYPELIKMAGPVDGIAASVNMKQSGTYTVEVWDTVTGNIISSEKKETEKKLLRISLPKFRIDCALKLKLHAEELD
ncbi:DUF5060 domain-containing protein [Planctomycetota bacterium]